MTQRKSFPCHLSGDHGSPYDREAPPNGGRRRRRPLLILTGVLSVESGFSYVDLNTLGVLIGMMLFVAVVKNSGIFEYIAIKAAKIAKGRPWPLMVLFALITAVLSAFLDNVTTVLLIGPMTLAITSMLRINPIPFFMTQIMASNIGGTATLIGDPPNIMIGQRRGAELYGFHHQHRRCRALCAGRHHCLLLFYLWAQAPCGAGGHGLHSAAG